MIASTTTLSSFNSHHIFSSNNIVDLNINNIDLENTDTKKIGTSIDPYTGKSICDLALIHKEEQSPFFLAFVKDDIDKNVAVVDALHFLNDQEAQKNNRYCLISRVSIYTNEQSKEIKLKFFHNYYHRPNFEDKCIKKIQASLLKNRTDLNPPSIDSLSTICRKIILALLNKPFLLDEPFEGIHVIEESSDSSTVTLPKQLSTRITNHHKSTLPYCLVIYKDRDGNTILDGAYKFLSRYISIEQLDGTIKCNFSGFLFSFYYINPSTPRILNKVCNGKEFKSNITHYMKIIDASNIQLPKIMRQQDVYYMANYFKEVGTKEQTFFWTREAADCDLWLAMRDLAAEYLKERSCGVEESQTAALHFLRRAIHYAPIDQKESLQHVFDAIIELQA